MEYKGTIIKEGPGRKTEIIEGYALGIRKIGSLDTIIKIQRLNHKQLNKISPLTPNN